MDHPNHCPASACVAYRQPHGLGTERPEERSDLTLICSNKPAGGATHSDSIWRMTPHTGNKRYLNEE
ncbi:hypothetical protein PAMP_001043 [Pampus punctatissimus]